MKPIHSQHLLPAAATVALMFAVSATFAQSGHEGHDHADHIEEPRNDHNDASVGGGHEGHEHDEEKGLRVEPQTMKEFGIVVQAVGAGRLSQSVRLPGEVVFNADRLAHVTPSVAGVVRRVDRSVGDRVKVGDVLAILGSRELAAARSESLASRARLDLARESLGRDERLLGDRIGTERQVLESRQAVREAEIAHNLAVQNLRAIRQAETNLDAAADAADAELDRYELRAPLDGVVVARHLTRGEVVAEQPDEVPFVVADLSSVWINLTVYQRDLAAVKAGQPVRITSSHGIADATGTIAFVSPSVDERTRTATARVVLSNPEGHWRPGMFVTVEVSSGSTRAAVVVPTSALQDLDGQASVFVQEGEIFEPRAVRVGLRTADTAEILDGLQPGERVVTQNGFALKAEMNRSALEHAGHAH